MVRLPVRYYGWGFQSLEETCAPAFLATLETSISRMTKVCPALTTAWGGLDCWGPDAVKESRWRKVLTSGTREALELKRSWDTLSMEAREAAAWLNKEIEDVFKTPLEGIGDGSVTGDTRRKIVDARERCRACETLFGYVKLPLDKSTATLRLRIIY